MDIAFLTIAAWPACEAMIRRIPRRRSYDEEPAHIFHPGRPGGVAAGGEPS